MTIIEILRNSVGSKEKVDCLTKALNEAGYQVLSGPRITGDGYYVCKVTFGAEPTEKEVMEFVDKNWNHLQFTQPIETPTTSESKKNPKRQLREAKKQMQSQGIGTKSQQALKLQQEQNKIELKQRSKAEREAEKQRQFDLRQAKKKEKHRGH